MTLLAMLAGQPPARGQAQPPAVTRDSSAGEVVRTPMAAPRRPVEQTPYADSLYALAGRPRTVGTIADPVAEGKRYGGRLLGDYNFERDALRLSRAESDSVQQATLAHELGHRLVSEQSPDFGYVRAFHAKRQQPGAVAPSGYAASNPAEHFAEAFAGAVGVLRPASRISPDSLVARRRAAERAVPGTDTLVTTLLAKPLYAGVAGVRR